MRVCVVNDCDEHVHVLLQLQEIGITQSICYAQGSNHLHDAGLYMHMYIYVCVHVHTYTYIITSYVCTYMCMYVCMYVRMYVYTRTHLDAYMSNI